jgi:hypothetical protein
MHSKVNFNDFLSQLNEDIRSDNMIPDSQRQQLGLKSEVPAQQTSVNDMMRRQARTDVAPENIPYPLGQFEDTASEAYVAIQNLEQILKIAKTNEVIKNKKPLDAIGKELINLKKEIVDISRKVSKIK